VHIKAIHAETRGCYGWPRIWKELLARGVRVGKERVQKLMQLHGIRARGKRRFKSHHRQPPRSADLTQRAEPRVHRERA
jgi:putative transposase